MRHAVAVQTDAHSRPERIVLPSPPSDAARLTLTKLGINFTEHFAKELATLGDLEADGLIRRNPGGLEVTNIGRLFIGNIAMRFDNQLALPGERRHSRTI